MLIPENFHHLGIAVRNLSAARYQLEFLGYTREGELWRDDAQGVCGLFMLGGNGRIELVENIPVRITLNGFLETGNFMPYHTAYWTENLEHTLRKCREIKGRRLSSPAAATAFGGRRICFVAFPHAGIVEFIEKPPAAGKTSDTTN